jgi:hypothetical protein
MPRDLRKYTQDTNIRLIIGGVLILFIVGIGLIYLFYGQSAALAGLLCMGVGFIPLILIFVVFAVLDWIVKYANKG